MEFFKIRRTIPFMRHALIFNVISLITFLAAVFFLVHKGLNFSIEFTGGTQIEVGYKEAANVDAIRRTLDRAGYKAEVQNFGSSREVLIRMHLDKNQSSAELSQKVLGILKEENASAELRRVEFVGPQVGSAITGVISRTIITHLCTQMMVTTMLLFGGPALHYFALALTIGICFGIYSSVLVASPLVMWLGAKRDQFVKPLKRGGARDEHEGAVV